MAQTITLERFHELLSNSYAVSVNDTLYFVGYDDSSGSPYIADNDGNDYVDLSSVDGDIEVNDCAVLFFIAEQPYRVLFLNILESL
jgi:4-aminobutyrate aminotransferase-like enzyme